MNKVFKTLAERIRTVTVTNPNPDMFVFTGNFLISFYDLDIL
jgi:hypothetical protein